MNSTFRIRPAILIFLLCINTGALAWYFTIGRQPASPIRSGSTAPAASFSALALPEFSLTDSTGSAVTRADFLGRSWVVDFIYTDCPAQCPMMTTKMSALQKTLPAGVGFVSISVNPEKDSPAILASYAERYGADPARWRFLTGRKTEIGKVQASLGAPAGAEPDAHSLRFYLVDQEGRLAGFYDTSSEGSIRQLLSDARLLAGEGEA